MNKNIRQLTLAVFSAIAAVSVSTQAADTETENLRNETQQAVASFKKTDTSLTKFFDDSAGYAVFPNVGKGGLVVGGAHGKGLVYEKNNLIGQATMTQA